MHGKSPLKISSSVMPAPLPGRAKRPGAVFVPGNNNHRSPTSSSSIIRPEVKWHPKTRPKPTNTGWGIAFKILYAVFVASSIFFIAQSRPRYERSVEDGGRKVLHPHYLGEIKNCCASIKEDPNVELAPWGLCGRPEVTGTSGVAERRNLSTTKKYEGDEGMFDVLLENPQILGGIFPATALLAIAWVLLLRQFSVKMVFATELIKAFVAVAIVVVTVQSTVVAVQVGLILAALVVGIATKRKEDLVKAARTIGHSVAAFHSNPSMLAGLFALKAVFLLHAVLFVATLVLAFDVVTVRRQIQELNDTGEIVVGCDFEYDYYVAPVTRFQCLFWIWIIFVYDQIRLSTISTVVGSRHFHAEEKKNCTVWRALYNALTTSFGSLALAGALSMVFDSFRKDRRSPSNVTWWLTAPQSCVLLPLQMIMWACGSCIADALALYVRFAVILHSFTGQSLKNCAAKCKDALKRNFLGGYITAYSARSVLFTTAYIFSVGIALATWAWIDLIYGADSLKKWMSGESTFWIVIFQLLVLVLAFAYPTISIFGVVRVNVILEDRSKGFLYSGQETTQHQWIGPLAAVFVGCIAMIIFRFVTGILLDIVDTKFLCFAIDEDNGIDRSAPSTGEFGDEELSEREQEQRTFAALVKAMPDYAVAVELRSTDVDIEVPIVPGIVQQDLPPMAEISIDGSGSGSGSGSGAFDAVEFVEDGQSEEAGFEDEDDRFFEVTLEDTGKPDRGEIDGRVAEVIVGSSSSRSKGRFGF